MAYKNSSKRIASVVHGKQMIMGTDWPIESYVDRVEYLGAVKWRLTKLLCNGNALGAETYKTKREALSALHALEVA